MMYASFKITRRRKISRKFCIFLSLKKHEYYFGQIRECNVYVAVRRTFPNKFWLLWNLKKNRLQEQTCIHIHEYGTYQRKADQKETGHEMNI
jgi:hypothetical protein